MDKVTIDCDCGNTFDVDDIDPGEKTVVRCPSCSAEVDVDGDDPAPEAGDEGEIQEVEGEPVLSSREAFLEKLKQKPVLIGIGVAGGAVLLIVVLLLVLSGGRTPPPDIVRRSPPPRRAPAPQPATPVYPETKIEEAPPEPEPPPPPPKPRYKAFPYGIRRDLREMILALHPFYRDLCVEHAEVDWIQKALAVGMGRDEDVKYLKSLLDRASVRLVNEEKARIAATYRKLAKQMDRVLPVDRVRFMDGGWVDGVIVEEVEGGVRVRRYLDKGPKVVTYPKKQVRYLLRGRGVGSKFLSRWEFALDGTMDDRIKVYEWGTGNNLKSFLDLVRWRILMDDPGYTKFRNDLGLPADPIVAAVNAAFARGNILYGQREWPPLELKDHLLREGHLLSQGRWYSPVDKEFSIPGLMKDVKATPGVRIEKFGIDVNDDIKRTYRSVGTPQSPQYRQIPEDAILRRFYAPPLRTQAHEDPSRSVVTSDSTTVAQVDAPIPPEGTPMKGHLLISVEVGEPVVAARVLMVADVKAGSWIDVSVINDGVREHAYRVTRRDVEEHPLPLRLRGKSRIVLEVAFHTQAAYRRQTDQYLLQQFQAVAGTQETLQPRKLMLHERMIPDYRAIVMPSWPNTEEAFRLTATVVRPNPELDKLYERFPKGILK